MTFLVNNPSTAPRLFAIALSDGNGWIVGGGPVLGGVGPVSPGQSGAVNVLVRMDPQCSPQIDVLDFQATASDLPAPNGQSCATTLTCDVSTTAVPQPEAGPCRLALVGPNPSRGGTLLSYAVARGSQVRIEVFSVLGQRVRTLVNREVGPGEYTARFALREEGARDLGPGVYLVRMTAGEWTKGIRVVALN